MPKSIRLFVAILMSVFMTNIPHVAAAEAADEMIPTTAVVEQMTRAQTREKIDSYVNRAEVRSELAKRGISAEEVSQRLASLSDSELRQLSSQMDQAMYGGEPITGILIIVLLVVLIIYLAKRI